MIFKTLYPFACILGLLATTLNSPLANEIPSAQVPILLYASRTDCHFCYKFEEEILKPLIRSGEYAASLIIHNLVLDSPDPVKNFAGQFVPPKELALTYDINVTPTLLFLDPKGRELIPRIVGYQRSEFYFYYFEDAIRKATTTLNRASFPIEH
jgi:thioredoxin-related protein